MSSRSSQIRRHFALTIVSALPGFALFGIAAIALHAETPQQVATQTAPAVSRGGPHVDGKQLLQSPAPAVAVQDSSPLFTFTFGLIDYPRSQVSELDGINDSGRMVGGYNNTTIELLLADHGFELKKNTFSTVDYPGALQTEVLGINKSGQMVGDFVDTSGYVHGFKLAGGTYTQLDYPGAKNYTVAWGINSSGEIVGIYDDPVTANQTGFLLSGGTYTSIVVPGASLTFTEGINKASVIVGYYFDNSGNSHGFTWNKGTITTIDYGNGYPNTYLAGINDSGAVVGGYGSYITIGSLTYFWEHGFLYSGGTFSTFDAPFGDVVITSPFGLNNNGEIVGGYVDSKGMNYGFYLKAQ